MKIKQLFASSEYKDSLGSKFRNKRFKHFEAKLLKLQKPIRILDIGGKESFWLHRNSAILNDAKITLVNLIEERVSHPNISSMIGDGTTLSQFHDNSFDVAFSNSVIEHLTTFANQVKMANEMKRLGKYFYVQTPNKYFFIEPHFILPFFQFYPRWLKVFVLTKTKLSRGKKRIRERAEKYIDEIRLLSLSDMKSLFPGAEIYYEKFGFFTKSFVFHNFK